MTRSNKKKKSWLKPPPSIPPAQQTSSLLSIESLLKQEQSLMTARGKASAKKHGINLVSGSKISGDGNCAFKSALSNVNERACFEEKFPFSHAYYRRLWVTDMKSRTLGDETWQVYSSDGWEAGWQEMMESGVYERGIFGDLMLFGIACGLRKRILIFNTNLDSPHDPIYVVEPNK